jgi:hypothetical protein
MERGLPSCQVTVSNRSFGVVDAAHASNSLGFGINLSSRQEALLDRHPSRPRHRRALRCCRQIPASPNRGWKTGRPSSMTTSARSTRLGSCRPVKGSGFTACFTRTTDQHLVIDPVTTVQRIPGLGQNAGHSDADRTTNFAFTLNGVGPQERTTNATVQVGSHRQSARRGVMLARSINQDTRVNLQSPVAGLRPSCHDALPRAEVAVGQTQRQVVKFRARSHRLATVGKPDHARCRRSQSCHPGYAARRW